jgi:hypothetical protein
MKLSLPEIATILAALQLYRESGYGNPEMYRWVSPRITAIADWSGRVEPLEDKEIDVLMSRIRASGEALA